ncbi:hypothetical protein FRC07_014299, partial [Ceratobasidium sp. 392]
MSKTAIFIGAEYMGQKVVLRGDPNYDVTISSVKKAFKGLRSVSVDRISISALLDEFGGVYEIPEEAWETYLPKLKH